MSGATANPGAVSAAGLLASFGINTQASFDTTGAYDNSSLIIRSLNYLGIDTVRDSMRTTGVPAQVLSAMADAGIKFDVVTPSNVAASGAAGIKAFVDSIAAFQTTHPGAVIAVEGQNEVNLFKTVFGTDTSLASAVSVQKELYGAVKASGALAGVSVYNLTVGNDDSATYKALGDMSKYSDYANAHVYTGNASNITQRFADSVSLAAGGSSGHATVVTEMGLTTAAGSMNLSVDELSQAKMTLADLLLAYSQGSAKSYIYQLFDTPESTGTAASKAFGLFNADGTAKLAATAVHNFTTLLSADNGAAMAGSFTVQGLGSDGHSMNVAKGSGATDLVLWRDVAAWNYKTGSTADVAANTVTVTFDTVQAHVYVYSPVNGMTPIASYQNVSSIRLPVSDTPLIVELGTDKPITVPPTAAATPTLSFDEKSFVAEIDNLSHMTGLSSIQLTGDHVLKVSSMDTMHDIIKTYGSLLSKVSGGYSFMVEKTGTGWWTDTKYDQSGKLVSTSTYSQSGTSSLSLHVDNADGSTADYAWANKIITKEMHVATDGTRTVMAFDAAGNMTSRQDTSPANVKTMWVYDTKSGDVTMKTVTNPDKSGDTYHYGITGQSYTSDHYVLAAGGTMASVTRYHADGTLDYFEQANSGGGKLIDYFDAAGHKMLEAVTAANGSKAFHGYTQVTDQQTVSVNLYSYTSAQGAKLSFVGTPTVNLVDSTGKVIKELDASAYTLKGSILTVNAGAVGGLLHAGEHAYVDVTYKVSDGTKVAPVSMYSIQIDGTLAATPPAGAPAGSTVTLTASDLVSGIVGLSQNASLSTIQITGDHVIKLGSAQAVSDMLSKYGSVLDKVHGGFSFMVEQTGVGQKVQTAYDQAGKLVSTSTYTLSGTSVTALKIVRADGATDSYTYTGGAVTKESHVAADGSSSTIGYDGAGHMATRLDIDSQKVTTSYTYDVGSGALSRKSVVAADKSSVVEHYGITGQTYVSERTVLAANGATVGYMRLHADGTLDYQEQVKPDGTKITDSYDAAGHITKEISKAANGSSSTFSYDSAGRLTVREDVSVANVHTTSLFDTGSGAVTSVYVVNPDKSGDTYHYGITGQTYVSDHYVLAKGGETSSVSRYHADGSLDYYEQANKGGGKLIDYYDATGHKTLEVVTAANGAKTFHAYNGVTDQQAVTASLFSYTSATGAKLAIAGTPTVNLVDDNGKVIKALDASAYSIKNGVLTLNAGATGTPLHVGEHANIDVGYAVGNGSTTAPASTYSLRIDGTLHLVNGTSGSETLDNSNAAYAVDIKGMGGNDKLVGGAGNDFIYGGDGHDTMIGGAGNDWLIGGTGSNLMTGGAGADRFVASFGANDTITDFRFGEGDKIDLSQIDAISTNRSGSLDHFTFTAGERFTGKAGQLIVVKDPGNLDGMHWLVEGDTTGSGHANYILHVTTPDTHVPTANDFIFS